MTDTDFEDPEDRPITQPPSPADLAAGVPQIHVFGDSHCQYFFRMPQDTVRIGLRGPRKFTFTGQSTPGAALAGLRPGPSTLDTKAAIADALPSASHLILAFGQVDLEIGFYHRVLNKGEDLDPKAYVAWLLAVYTDYLDTILPQTQAKIALKGVNLTTLAPRPYAARTILRLIDRDNRLWDTIPTPELVATFHSEDEQNAMHLDFNAGLERLAANRGLGYFDIVKETAVTDDGAIRLNDLYKPGRYNHHIVDNIVVRRFHYMAAARIFGLVPTRPGTPGKRGEGRVGLAARKM